MGRLWEESIMHDSMNMGMKQERLGRYVGLTGRRMEYFESDIFANIPSCHDSVGVRDQIRNQGIVGLNPAASFLLFHSECHSLFHFVRIGTLAANKIF